MKRIIPVLFFLLVMGMTARAQQDAVYSQYMFNQLSINPAYAGSWEYMTATLLYRKQWVGMNGAPETQGFTLHSPTHNERHGFGFGFYNDLIGITQNTELNIAYAYKIHLAEHARISLGIQGAAANFRANFGKVRTGSDIDPANNGPDPSFSGNLVNLWLPNAGAGVFFHTRRFYAGASSPRLIAHRLGESGSVSDARQQQHFFITTGLVLGGDDAAVKFKPSLLGRFVPGAPVSFDFNAQLLFANRLWLGASYRMNDAIVGMMQLQLNNWLRVGYAYDHITSVLNTYASASHEFMLGIDMNFKSKSMVSPRFF